MDRQTTVNQDAPDLSMRGMEIFLFHESSHWTYQYNMNYSLIPKLALVFKCLQYKSSENTVGKVEIAHIEQFLLFLHCFLPIWRNFCHFYQIRNCRLQTLSVWKSLKFVVWEWVKPPATFQHKQKSGICYYSPDIGTYSWDFD